MKITRITPLIVNANMRNWIFVKVETDEPGLYGWGEATLEWKTRSVAGAIEDLAELLAAWSAQGVDGFNIPSLFGVAVGGPYLHGGAAETLEDLLDPAGDFGTHLRAGNQVFSPTDTELADLIAFLRSIDDSTPTFAIPSDQDFCPDSVSFD